VVPGQEINAHFATCSVWDAQTFPAAINHNNCSFLHT